MPISTSVITGTVAHKHELDSATGGYLAEGLTGITGGVVGEVLTATASDIPEWKLPGDAHSSGQVTMWAGTNANIPTGWLLCDGSSVATATYPDLHTAIGYVYGGAGANFNLPNFIDKFSRGVATQTAGTGGANSKTLSISEIPSHTHVVSDPGHSHSMYDYNGGSGQNACHEITGSAQAAHLIPDPPIYDNTTGITNANTGGGGSFNNQPSYLEIQFIIKT
tara:strand:- start:806 stop:1471 length:666 start_codon:yes stop_codon:yes gene_type:complete